MADLSKLMSDFNSAAEYYETTKTKVASITVEMSRKVRDAEESFNTTKAEAQNAINAAQVECDSAQLEMNKTKSALNKAIEEKAGNKIEVTSTSLGS